MQMLQVYLIGGKFDGLGLFVSMPSPDIPSAVYGNSKEEAEVLRSLQDSDKVKVVYDREGKRIEEVIEARELFNRGRFGVGRNYWSCDRNLIQRVDSVDGLFKKLLE